MGAWTIVHAPIFKHFRIQTVELRPLSVSPQPPEF
jgi:hypothetical protein